MQTNVTRPLGSEVPTKTGDMVEKQEMLEYLDDLRTSGVTNMFGAAPYLADTFDLDIRTARRVLTEWMETFGQRHQVT